MKKHHFQILAISLLASVMVLAGCGHEHHQADHQPRTEHYQDDNSWQGKHHHKHYRHENWRRDEYRSSYHVQEASGKPITQTTPSEKLAKSVLTPEVVQQLGGLNNIKWNDAGAFIINHNLNNLKVPRSHRPYAQNEVDSLDRPTEGNALLTHNTRQYRKRSETGNGASHWRPKGFEQMRLSGMYNHLYDRGHLLGYALIGNIKGFNASESNTANIATQTAWANEANSEDSTGQNYYESLVRQALDHNQVVRYRVVDIYQGRNLVPSGAHIEAKSADDTLEFNVFVPNVQPGVVINYTTGRAKVA